MQKGVHILLLDGDQGLSDVIKRWEVWTRFHWVNTEWKVDLDIGGSLRKNDTKGEVLSQDIIEVMVKCIVQKESALASILEQMIPRRDVIALAPVDFPLTHYWESGLNLKRYLIFFAVSIRWWYISNVVPIVETSDVAREISLKALDCIWGTAWVPTLVINSAKLSLDACSLVEHLVVFINIDVSPVRNLDSFLHLLEYRHRLVIFIVENHFREGERLHILKRSILYLFAFLIGCGVRCVEKDALSRVLDWVLLSLCWVYRDIVLRVDESQGELFSNRNLCWECLLSPLVNLSYCDAENPLSTLISRLSVNFVENSIWSILCIHNALYLSWDLSDSLNFRISLSRWCNSSDADYVFLQVLRDNKVVCLVAFGRFEFDVSEYLNDTMSIQVDLAINVIVKWACVLVVSRLLGIASCWKQCRHWSKQKIPHI